MFKRRAPLRRVDIQVSILVVFMILVSTICIFVGFYLVTYHDMIISLEDRVNSIYYYLEDSLDKTTFVEITGRQDMERENYQIMKRLLEAVRDTTGVLYLYTAKENSAGELIYVVDGLSKTAPDFRYPGDPIEPEIQPELRRALAGEPILPKAIMNTDWGKIFIAYLPIHQGDTVIGVLGIEFEAEHQYNTYLALRIITPLVILLFSGFSTLFALHFFRRISNPTYLDMSNTDQLTQLKSRNAFEVDTHNLDSAQKRDGLGVLIVDLNNLKWVNDTLGHEMGDSYLQYAAGVLTAAVGKKGVVYRTGGDEFVLLLPQTSPELLKACKADLAGRFQADCPAALREAASLAIGFAVYDSHLDSDVRATCKRADACMYEDKRACKRPLPRNPRA